MTMNTDPFAMQNWYPRFGNCAFPASFALLREEAIARLAGTLDDRSPDQLEAIDQQVIDDLRPQMASLWGNSFVSVDTVAPTDTERFALKRGAIHSPESAWYFLLHSLKVRDAARRGEVSCVCLRPFRRMTIFREFRLFIREGELVAMSQYHLIRHFHRLEKLKDFYWEKAQMFVAENAWRMPLATLCADIYFTSNDEILLVDLNPWGEPTDPLLLRSWDRNWSECAGLLTMEPPTQLHGDVDVSF